MPPQGALATEEAVIASRVDILDWNLEILLFVFVVAQAYPYLVFSVNARFLSGTAVASLAIMSFLIAGAADILLGFRHWILFRF